MFTANLSRYAQITNTEYNIFILTGEKFNSIKH